MKTETLLYTALSVALLWYISRRVKLPAIEFSPSGVRLVDDKKETTAARIGVQPSTLAFIAQREGLRLTAYPDAAGYSIGYGHYLGTVPKPASITKQQADAWLESDALKAAIAVTQNVTVSLTQNQFDALVSFVYNIGAGAFKDSTLLHQLNAGNIEGAAAQFNRWIYSQGQINPGLVTRRNAERMLFLT